MLESYKEYCRFVFSARNDNFGVLLALLVGWSVMFLMFLAGWIEFLSVGMNASKMADIILYPLPFYAPHFVLAFLYGGEDDRP